MLSKCLLFGFALSVSAAAYAQDTPVNSDSATSRWMDHVSEIQAAQPHWVTPLVTVTPRLEQEVRLDYVNQQNSPAGNPLVNYGNGKGLELIPFDNTEVIINAPPYLQHNDSRVQDGFGDFAAVVKYRILSANEKEGNYILTAFLGVSVPTGQYKNGSPATIITPTISAGKGWGDFDIQSTLAILLPDIQDISHTIQWNTAFQYHIWKLWPEVEFNYAHYTGGESVGKDQLFITPGVMFGKFPIYNRVGFTVGGGVQIAATNFHSYDHAYVISARLPF